MIEKTFLNPATNKQWRIEIDGHTIRTCLNGGKGKEILCDSTFQVKTKIDRFQMGDRVAADVLCQRMLVGADEVDLVA